MRILVDENIPLMTVAALRGIGHDVLDVRGTADQGSDDPTLWQIAQQEARLLVTTDKGEIVLVDPVPDRHRELTRFPVLEGRTWATPALAGPFLLVRSDREAACYELPRAR